MESKIIPIQKRGEDSRMTVKGGPGWGGKRNEEIT